MGQKERVIKYIETFGSISPMEAFMDLGVTKLATIISYLRYKENKIVYQKFMQSTNRYGESCYYMRYWLNKDQYIKDTEVIEELQDKKKYDPMDELFLKEEI